MNTIWWSETGETACEKHAPRRDSDTWRLGRWRAMTLAERVQYEAEVGERPECECCKATREERP